MITSTAYYSDLSNLQGAALVAVRIQRADKSPHPMGRQEILSRLRHLLLADGHKGRTLQRTLVPNTRRSHEHPTGRQEILSRLRHSLLADSHKGRTLQWTLVPNTRRGREHPIGRQEILSRLHICCLRTATRAAPCSGHWSLTLVEVGCIQRADKKFFHAFTFAVCGRPLSLPRRTLQEIINFRNMNLIRKYMMSNSTNLFAQSLQVFENRYVRECKCELSQNKQFL